ncbi:MAG: tyrosine-type recombinase/integrase [Lachnospiraceae bacterium]|nr:tyrosine-type recombinase/integrase [Lachnospiraceae bacterium]MBQ1173539.1 tyrosine-type recombinase/integrase [Lachnospiraceae bacterium]
MKKSTKRTIYTDAELINVMNDVTIPYEERCNLSEDYMRRKDILRLYDIKQLKGETDQRYYVIIDGKKSKKFTHQKDLENYLIELNKSLLDDNMSLKDIYDDFIEARRLGKASATFKKDIYYYQKFIGTSTISEKPIKDIIYMDGIDFFKHCNNIYKAKHQESMKKKYFDNILGALNNMMTFAKKNYHIISENPLADLEIHKDNFAPKLKKTDNVTIYSDEERIAFKQEAYKFAKESNESKYLAGIIFFNLGIRDAELMALKWYDIIEDSHIHVHSELIEDYDKTGNFVGFKFVDHTKTEAGDRILQLNSEVKDVLKTIKKLNLKNGYPISNDDFIFQRSYRGKISHLTPRTVYTSIEKISKSIGMQEIKSAHDMRRTCFTNLFYAGMPIKDIQAFAGHEDVRMTEAYIKKKPSKDENVYLEAII